MATPARLGRRLLAGAIALAAFTVVGCADRTMAPNEDLSTPQARPTQGGKSIESSYSCPAAADIAPEITAIINRLYATQPSKILSGQLKKFTDMQALLPSKPAGAYKKMQDLIASATADLNQGKVDGIGSTAEDDVARLISLLYCYYNAYSGLAPIPVPDFSDEVNDGATVGYFDPNVRPTTQTFRSEDDQGGVVIPTNAYGEPLYIIISPILDDPSPLNTDLDQYPLFYDFHAEPVDGTLPTGATQVIFTNPVTVSICTEDAPDIPFERLRIAHNIAPYGDGDIEILPEPAGPETNPAGLTCTDGLFGSADEPAASLLGRSLFARLPSSATRVISPVVSFFMPQALDASAIGFCCKSGTTSSFSPFGAVDPLVDVTRTPTDGSFGTQLVGAQVTPTVTVTTADGSPTPGRALRWIDVEWVPGTGSVSDDTTTTNTTGEASTTWTLGAEGAQTLTATALPARKLPTGFSTQSATFTATTIVQAGFDYRSTWSYAISTGTEPSPTATLTQTAPAPFGSPSGTTSCTLNNASFGAGTLTPGTPWQIGTGSVYSYLLARRSFAVPVGTTQIVVKLTIDNDIRVWINSTEITQLAQRSSSNLTLSNLWGPAGAAGANTTYVAGEYLIHDNCPLLDDYSFTYTLPTAEQSNATHTITVIGLDRGGSSYFDAKVERVVPPVLF